MLLSLSLYRVSALPAECRLQIADGAHVYDDEIWHDPSQIPNTIHTAVFSTQTPRKQKERGNAAEAVQETTNPKAHLEVTPGLTNYVCCTPQGGTLTRYNYSLFTAGHTTAHCTLHSRWGLGLCFELCGAWCIKNQKPCIFLFHRPDPPRKSSTEPPCVKNGCAAQGWTAEHG